MELDSNPIVLKATEKLRELEKAVAEKKKFINSIYIDCEQQPPYSVEEIESGSETVSFARAIKPDEYFSLPQATAVQRVLERFKAADKAPVDIEDIVKTLKEGGYRFQTSDDKGARNSLYVMLSKNMTFVRVPNGKYGLRAWYPNLKSGGFAAKKKQKDSKEGGAQTVEAEQEAPDSGVETEGGEL